NACNGTSMGCVNNFGAGSGEFYINNNFAVGQTYLIRVINTNNLLSTSTTAFNVCVQNYPTPNNDLCANAITLTPNTNCVSTTGTFSGSSISTAAPSCATVASQDVWYQFTATDPTMSIWVNALNNNSVGVEIFQNACNGTSMGCVNNFGAGSGEFYINNNFVVGQTYLIRVINTNNLLSTSTTAFNVCVQNPNLSTIDINKPTANIYPNPVKNQLNIDTTYTIQDISLYDSVGKKIPVSYLSPNAIDVSQLSNGIYIINITDGNSAMITKKFIKI
ncbi:T9SS type A sorting domain-containing protein, partial [Flavobacterium sp.]